MSSDEELSNELDEILLQERISYSDSEKIKGIPRGPGIYIIYHKEEEEPWYVGETKTRPDVLIRITRHQKYPLNKGNIGRKLKGKFDEYLNWDGEKLSAYILENCSFRYKIVEDKIKRGELEQFCIKKLEPKLNKN